MTIPHRLRLAMSAVLLATTLVLPAQNKVLNQLAGDASKAMKKGNLKQADSLYTAYADLFRQEGHTKTFDYTEILEFLVRRATLGGQLDRAIRLQEEIIEVRRTAQDCTYAQWAAAVSDLASLYYQKGLYDKALTTGKEALTMLGKQFGTKHHYFCIALANVAGFYAARGETGDEQMAIELCEQALKHMKKGTYEYANALNSLVVFYSLAGRRADAARLSVKARKEARKRLGEDGMGYATVLNNTAIRLAKAGNYEEAIEYAGYSRECFEQSGNVHSLAYAKLLTNTATFHAHLQQYREAVALLEQALPVIEQSVGRNHSDYLRCMSELSNAHRGMGNLEKANEMAHQSDQLGRQLGNHNDVKYARSLSKQAATFASNGNYMRAMQHEHRAYEIYHQRADSLNMAFSLGLLANYQFSDGQQEKGLATARKALAIYEKQGRHTAHHAQALNNTAILYYNAHDYEQASTCGQQAMAIYRELADTVNAIYARITANNALFLFMKDSLQQAMTTARRAIALHSRILGDDHPDNVPLLYNLAIYLNKAGQRAQADSIYRQVMAMQAQQVRTAFLHLTSQEREKFWNQKSYVFRFAPMLAYLDRNNGLMTTEAYNAQLFSKGILLNSDVDFKKLLRQSASQELLNKYNQLEALRHDAESYYRMSAEQQQSIDLDHMRETIYQLERDLLKGCKEYGSFTASLSIDAAQVAASLAPDEAAIEFADVYVEGMGTTYLALVLRKDQPTPQLVRLFSDAELRDLKYGGGQHFFQALKTIEGTNLIYNDPRFGQMLWQPITSRLQGISKIFFSPTSLFYQMGIEYLPCDSTHRIGDLFAVYRLSSTKSLVSRKPTGKPQNATIYGGLKYDMTLAQLQEQHDLLASDSQYLLAMNTLSAAEPTLQTDLQRTLDSLSLRGTVHELPGTAHEADNIAEQLLQNNIEANVLQGYSGTEETFKALSGRRQSIVHLATHGFYFSESELKQRGQQLVFADEQTDHLDNALNYSGLLLAGANYALTGGKLPEGIENGILTSREIAQVDLSHVDLVVLSACQTGVGEIRDDGVFGIQRGFKKAGAHSLLMSLWKVSDQATDLMMTCFYRHLMQGHSRHRAFAMAQDDTRRGGFTDPYFWASFVLLDAQ